MKAENELPLLERPAAMTVPLLFCQYLLQCYFHIQPPATSGSPVAIKKQTLPACIVATQMIELN